MSKNYSDSKNGKNFDYERGMENSMREGILFI